MDEPFYYRSAEDVVPRDAVHIIVCSSVRVVPPRTFAGYENLARVEFQEGVEEIGAYAFAGCPNLVRIDWSSSLRTIGDQAFSVCVRLSELLLPEGLEEIGAMVFADCPNLRRVDCPSSLRTIGDGAFYECERLSEVVLREGLEKIGREAFLRCNLDRITIPSSVVKIGAEAFYCCERLSEVNLTEGLQQIEGGAFCGCALDRITVPSSVVEIGEEAFTDCDNLEAVTLAGNMWGGVVMVAARAFNCPRLGRIAIPSMAIVVKRGEDGNGRVVAVTGGFQRDPADESSQLIFASPHLASMHPEELSNLTDAIDRAADMAQGARPLDLADGDVSTPIRDCFVDHLSTWYKREVATILELELWKIELGRAAGAAREVSRVNCGADPIVGLVLSSLAGPHRRAGQEENAGSIQH